MERGTETTFVPGKPFQIKKNLSVINNKYKRMERINSKNIDIVRDSMKAALSSVEARYGVTIKLGNTSYDDTHFTTKMTVSVGDGSEYEQKIWDTNARLFGLPKDWLNKEFINDSGIGCKITGINPKAYKMPVKYEEVLSGKKFKTTVDGIKSTMIKPVNFPV